nr:unnamed protein product [Spirometra erinaceieuropaei]
MGSLAPHLKVVCIRWTENGRCARETRGDSGVLRLVGVKYGVKPTYWECSRYLLAIGKLAIEESQPSTCLWPLPAGQRGSCRLRRVNHRRLEKLTSERADERQEVPVAVTGRPKRVLSNEESQPSTIGEANQRTPRRKTGRYDCTEDWKCLWPLPVGQRGSCRMRRADRPRSEKLTNEGADARLEVPVAVTGRSKRELSIEESQPSTIGEANQRTRRRKTGRASGRYRPVNEGAIE